LGAVLVPAAGEFIFDGKANTELLNLRRWRAGLQRSSPVKDEIGELTIPATEFGFPPYAAGTNNRRRKTVAARTRGIFSIVNLTDGPCATTNDVNRSESSATRIQIAMRLKLSLFLRIIAFSVVVLGAYPTVARDLFVNNIAGDDLFNGAAPTSIDAGQGPFRTLRRALKSAGPGDRIILAKTDVPYQESVSLVGSPKSGSSSLPFIIEGQGATFDGTREVTPDAWQLVSGDIFRFQPERKQYQELYLDGVPATRRPNPNEPGRVPNLEPKEWALVGGWIYFRVEHGRLPQQYDLRYAYLASAFTLYKVEGVIIHDLIVQGYALDGLYLNDTRGPCLLSGLNCRGNARSGVAVVGAAKADLNACLLADNGQCQLLVEGYSGCNLSNCDVVGNTGPQWTVGRNSELRIDGKQIDTKQP
jgi:hypothetical protein